MLMRGFTTVRDAAGADLGHKLAVERGFFTGPRLFVAGRAVSHMSTVMITAEARHQAQLAPMTKGSRKVR